MTIPVATQLAVVLLALWVVMGKKDTLAATFVAVAWMSEFLTVEGLGPNVGLSRLTALLLLPRAALALTGAVKRDRAIAFLAFEWLWAIVLGVLFGWIVAWPDVTGLRPWQQAAAGRSVISCVRRLADLSGLVFLAEVGKRKGVRPLIYKVIAVFGIVQVLAALAEDRFAFRFAEMRFPEARESWGDRPGGLNGEPRVLGRVSAVVGLVALTGQATPNLLRLGALGAAGVGLALSGSASAMWAAGFAALIAAIYAIRRRGERGVLAGALVAGIVVTLLSRSVFERSAENVGSRWETVVETPDRELDETSVVAALEVFDRAALRFLIDRPAYLLTGAGPDLISLPASDYMPRRAVAIFGDRIDSVPHTGILWVVGGTGFVGLLLWLGALRARWVALDTAGRRWEQVLLLSVAAFSVLVYTPALVVIIGLTGDDGGVGSANALGGNPRARSGPRSGQWNRPIGGARIGRCAVEGRKTGAE